MNPRLREREVIFAIGRALMAELELSEVLRVILNSITELVGSKVGIIVLEEPMEKAFRIVATYGIPSHVIGQRSLLRGITYENDQFEAINEVKQRVRVIAEATDSGLVNSVGLPMYNGNEILGAIFFFHDHEQEISGSMARFLQSFAAWAAIAVKNARLYEAVSAEKRRLNAIIQQSADGVMILDRALNISEMNRSLANMLGITTEKARGHAHRDVIKWATVRSKTDLYRAIADGWPVQGESSLYVEGDYKKRNGSLVTLGITYAPLLNDKGQTTSVIANVRDLTRFREEEQLHKTFISVVSHELKTPVSIIKGYAGTLMRDDVEWPREIQHEYLETITEEADSLTDLIDNLLEASRLQSGTFSLDLHEEVCLIHTAGNVVKRFQPQTEKHTLKMDFPKDFPEIHADERRLTQVFNNLISNAIKYSPKGGDIVVSGETYPEQVILNVSDSGIGIPSHEAHRVFQQFSRLDNALSRKTEGTGLGLFLTKAIIEAHGGEIWFEDNGDEPGTTFSFSLPTQ